jgi:predicted ArsR family transcriptional regulator
MTDDGDLDAIGVFAEPQRRRVYEQLQVEGPLSVSDLVTALEMGRTLVAFHLGKLVDASFVEAVPPEPATGTLGRPPQRYRVTRREVVAAVPERRYDLLAGVLLDGLVDNRPGESARVSALRAAHRRGAGLARGWAAAARSGTAREPLHRLVPLLTSLGYTPQRHDAELIIRNCPFDKFRSTNTAEICPLNQALCDGYLEGLGLDDRIRTRLRPHSQTCCVVFRLTAPTDPVDQLPVPDAG